MRILGKSEKGIRKTAGALMLAGTLMQPYGQSYLPVEKETREAIRKAKETEVAGMEAEYTNAVRNAKSIFNEALKDRSFSLSEQTNVYRAYERALELEKRLNAFRKADRVYFEKDDIIVQLDVTDLRLYTLLGENMKLGQVAGLENAFANEELDVKIEGKKEYSAGMTNSSAGDDASKIVVTERIVKEGVVREDTVKEGEREELGRKAKFIFDNWNYLDSFIGGGRLEKIKSNYFSHCLYFDERGKFKSLKLEETARFQTERLYNITNRAIEINVSNVRGIVIYGLLGLSALMIGWVGYEFYKNRINRIFF